MPKKTTLTQAFAGERNADPATAAALAPPASAAIPPSRQGRKAMTLYLDPAAHKQLKLLAIDLDRPAHGILLEALDDYFRKCGKPPIANPPV